ncbi:MAG: DUF3489 domain-containing protein [Proteobacteria bacterium]|nr:MAG: DUF3489 domain-containing protein [Pseudomonadota bacterium]
MTMTTKPTKLTPTQEAILKAAAKRPDGDIEPLPANVTPGVRQRVVDGMLSRALVTRFPGGIHRISHHGYESIGMTPPTAADTALDAALAKTRTGTKQETLLKLLSRPQGATIDELAEALNWQKHTVRGTMSHTLKKRLGLTITSEKGADGVRRYRFV